MHRMRNHLRNKQKRLKILQQTMLKQSNQKTNPINMQRMRKTIHRNQRGMHNMLKRMQSQENRSIPVLPKSDEETK